MGGLFCEKRCPILYRSQGRGRSMASGTSPLNERKRKCSAA